MNQKWTLLMLCHIAMIQSAEHQAKKTVATIPLAVTWTSNSCKKSVDYAVRRSSVGGGAWYAVCGGCNGKAAATSLAVNLHKWFEQAPGTTIEEKMKAAFVQANKQNGYQGSKSSVAVVFIDKDKTVHIAHLGDCGVALIQNGIVQKITKAHTALNETEVDRINKLNIHEAGFENDITTRYGRVYGDGDTYTDLTRFIGRHRLCSQAIIPEPEYVSYSLIDPLGQVIMGSYGFWKDFPKTSQAPTPALLKKYLLAKSKGTYENNGNEVRMIISLGKEFDRCQKVKSNIWRSVQLVGVAGLLALLLHHLYPQLSEQLFPQ